MTRWYREGSWAGCLEVGLSGSHGTPSRKGGELDTARHHVRPPPWVPDWVEEAVTGRAFLGLPHPRWAPCSGSWNGNTAGVPPTVL